MPQEMMCHLQDDWAIEWPSTNMTAIGGRDIGSGEADFQALHSMVDGRVEGAALIGAGQIYVRLEHAELHSLIDVQQVLIWLPFGCSDQRLFKRTALVEYVGDCFASATHVSSAIKPGSYAIFKPMQDHVALNNHLMRRCGSEKG